MTYSDKQHAKKKYYNIKATFKEIEIFCDGIFKGNI